MESTPKWPGEAWEMLPKKVKLALLTKDSVIIWLPLTEENSGGGNKQCLQEGRYVLECGTFCEMIIRVPV